jgi:hypothetical protein
MRLPGISDRLAERFVKPLLLDRILALVKPALREARAGAESPSFARLKIECNEYLATTLGSALEPQSWLQTLEEEVQHVESDGPVSADSAPRVELPAARAPISLDDLRRQLEVWEKPLEEK